MCKCGTAKAKCKNRQDVQEVNNNPSAFARHQEQLELAEIKIKVNLANSATKFKQSTIYTHLK